MHALKGLVIACVTFLACAGAMSAPLHPGQPLPSLQLKNQHDQTWQVTPQTRLLIFAAGRKASNMVMEVLGSQPAGFLASRQVAYLADMSRMPGFITRTFALPALREQKFDVGVSLDERALTDWPREEDAVTLIRLQNGRVLNHEFVRTNEQLKAVLDL